MTKQLALNNTTLTATVDEEDYERLSRFTWTWKYNNQISTHDEFDNSVVIPIANIVMCNPDVMYDHKDRNPLNNQKSNLRLCDKSQNSINITKYIKRNASIKHATPYKGVSFKRERRKWRARLCDKHLGYFDTDREAARAYDTAVKEKFGEFAVLNFPYEVAHDQ